MSYAVTAWKWKFGSEKERKKFSAVKGNLRGPIWKSRSLPAQLLTSSGVNAFSAVSVRAIMACRSTKGIGPTSAGGANRPLFTASSAHTEWWSTHSIWKWKGAMSSNRLTKTDSPVPDDWVTNGVRLPSGTELRSTYKGETYVARVNSGALVLQGQRFDSPSAAA